jgi:maltooligosyltrehalose trehalohydrolase
MSKRVELEESHRDFAMPPCGALVHANGSASFRVWAPRAQSVEIVLSDRGAREGGRALAMQREADGYFSWTGGPVEEGQRYGFRLDGGPVRPDPASRWQPEGVHRPSAVVALDRFDWSEGDWPGLARELLVIYELHVGTFTAKGTLDEAIGRLEELRELGITAIELMPVGQFPGERNWGYDGVHPYAVQNSYGGPRGLQRFVNACHRTGLAVILDVVYNHYGPEGNYLAEFGPYFTDAYRTPWGTALNFDQAGSHSVRAFVLDNVRMWLRDFRLDGLRVDAIHAIYDHGARHILREIKEAADQEARRLGRPVHVIAESDLNDVRLLDRTELGGYGLSAQWSDDFHHAVHALLTGERNSYYVDFGRPEQIVKALNDTFVYDGCYSTFRGRRHGAPAGSHPGSRFVVSLQNHDQAGNRPAGDRFGTLLEPRQQRLAAGLLLLSPYLPLIFMGEEYGETRPFPFFSSFIEPQIAEAVRRGRKNEFPDFKWGSELPDPQAPATFESARLSWSWPEDSPRAGLRRLYYDLLMLRRFRFPLREFNEHSARLVTSEGEGSAGIIRLSRQGDCNGRTAELVVYFNLTGMPQRVLGDDRRGTGLLLSSESACYHGPRGNDQSLDTLLPYEFQIFQPA